MRKETDSMGQMDVPESALYGASTQQAILNFPILGYQVSQDVIRALDLVKWATGNQWTTWYNFK